MAERAADFRLAPGSEPDRQDRLPPPVLVGLVVKEALFSKKPLATHSRLGKIGSMKARKRLVPRPPITPAAKKVIYQPEARARDPVRFPRWRVGLICSSMRNFLAGVIFIPDKVPGRKCLILLPGQVGAGLLPERIERGRYQVVDDVIGRVVDALYLASSRLPAAVGQGWACWSRLFALVSSMSLMLRSKIRPRTLTVTSFR